MRVEIRHTTSFTFEDDASYSIHHARLTPRLGEGQRLLSWSLRGPGTRADWIDGYGNVVSSFTLPAKHSELAIELTGSYEWLAAATYLRHEDPEPLPTGFWLRNQGLARHDATIAEFVADLAPRAADEMERVPLLHDLMSRVYGTIANKPSDHYEPTPAPAALARRAGPFQDHAHVFIACCRAIGVPARYVSGYMSIERLNGAPATAHGWAEAFVPHLGWVGFDIAHSISPTGDYLKLAVGLDYAQAAPVTGRRTGGGEATMEVAVSFRRVGEAAANQ
jgi:transglutaminase-like putative cysteine protease